ncbi:MAG TPA: hypothetical protein VEK15_30190 [Vicinamibacteria bacterium]|nr:hypothetical protein [Vicinamibacteria bacterium]
MSQWKNMRRFLVLSVAVLSLGALHVSAQEYVDIRRLGTSNAISRPGPSTGEELQQVFRTNRADYEKVLADARWPGDPNDLFNAVESGSFSEASYPVGHTFEWMAVRKNGVAQPTRPIRWAGTAPFEAFEIRFESRGQEHRFLIPKACGNLALVQMRPVEPQIDLEALTPRLRVQSPNNCTGANVTVDVTLGTSMPEGGRLELTHTRPNGQRETINPSPAGGGHRWTGQLNDAGAHTFTAVVHTPAGPTRQVTERVSLEPCEPTCNIQLTPPPIDPVPKAGRASIGLDMCSSSARVGTLTTRTLKIHHTPVDGPEQLVETLSLESECSASYLLPQYGGYRFEGEVVDDRGMRATCQADYTLVQPEAKLAPFVTVFGGKERRVRELDAVTGDPAGDSTTQTTLSGLCSGLFGGTFGVAYPVADGGAQVFGQAGVAVNVEYGGLTSLFADFGIDKNFEGGFLGAGIGVWDFTHSDTVDGSFFVHGGFNLTETLQFKLEGRLFMSELGDIENNYAFFGGIRYFFRR